MKLKDIAVMANVSPATVSLVKNNRPGVGDEKRKQIARLLTDYGFSVQPDKEAIATSGKNLHFIKYKNHSTLVDGNPGFINSIIDAIELECRRQGYSLQMTTCNRTQLVSIGDAINDDPADGVLFLGTELDSDDSHLLSAIAKPMVIVDTYLSRMDLNCITTNNTDAIWQSLSYLCALGHTRIGFIANALASNNCAERRKTFQETLPQLGLEYDESLMYEAMPTPEGAYESIRALLEKGTAFPSAIVANHDSIALGTMRALREFGIRIPDDISIIGFDNIASSAVVDPPLSTMSVPCKEVGIWAVRMLCDRIRYPFSASTKMRVSPTLIIRNSTVPHRGNP